MRYLVLYFSLTGNTERAAKMIAQRLGADLEQVHDIKKRSGPWGFFTSGMDSVLKRKTKIRAIQNDIKNYDVLIVGSPVWAGHMAPAVRAILSEHKPMKAALFVTFQGSSGKSLDDLRQALKGVTIAAEIGINARELSTEKTRALIEEFCNKIRKPGAHPEKI